MVGRFHVFANGTLSQLHFDRHKYGNGLEMWFSNENGNSWASCFIPEEGLSHMFSKSIPVFSRDIKCICSDLNTLYANINWH